MRLERVFSITFLSVAAACDSSGESGHAGNAGEDNVPVRIGMVELRVGSQEGSDVETFSGIAGLALDALGRIFVADARASDVRVFAPDGAFLFRIGRQGSGPGEFEGPCCIRFDSAGRLWVRDGGNARYSVFDVAENEAALRFTIRMAHADVNFWAPIHFDDAGRLIDIGHRPAAAWLDLMHFHLDSTGTVTDTVRIPGVPPESIGVRIIERNQPQGVTRRFLYPPFGPRELVAHGQRGEYARAISSRYSIAWYDATGKLIRVIEQEGAVGAPLRENERAEAEQRIEQDARRFALTAAERFRVPERKQPLSNLVFDHAGRLWVIRSATRGDARSADVWERTGRLAFSAQWPADVDLSFNAVIRDSIALGVARDSLDVERVVRVRWRS